MYAYICYAVSFFLLLATLLSLQEWPHGKKEQDLIYSASRNAMQTLLLACGF